MDELVRALRSWNPWWEAGWAPEPTVPRGALDGVLDATRLRHVKDVIGVRRSGKTTLLQQVVAGLAARGAPPSAFAYVTFDDAVVRGAGFGELLDAVHRASPDVDHLIIDEGQERAGWERWVRALYDQRRFQQLFVTGSSASLLSRDVGRALTGRHVSFELQPYSFREHLLASGWEGFDPHRLLTETGRLQYHLERYLINGGFPEVAGLGERDARRVLSNVYHDIIARDVSARHGVEGEPVGRLAAYLLTNAAAEYSYRRLSSAVGLNVETVERYLGFLEEAFMVFTVPLFSYRLKTQFKQNKKVYAVDTGLRNHVAFRFSEDMGRLAENAVYLELRRRGKDVHYWKDGRSEVDFVVSEGVAARELVQVCWEPSEGKAWERELRGLRAAGGALGVGRGTVVTRGASGREVVDGFEVELVPLARWLLGLSRA